MDKSTSDSVDCAAHYCRPGGWLRSGIDKIKEKLEVCHNGIDRWIVLSVIDPVRHRRLRHLKRQFHHSQQDRTPLTPIFLPFQPIVRLILAHGDAIHTPRIANQVLAQTLPLTGSSRQPRKMEWTMLYLQLTTLLRSILPMQH